MPIRKATQADVEPIALLCKQSFWEDELLGDLLHPDRHEAPERFMDYFRKRIAESLGDAAHTCLVYENQQDERGSSRIAGFADWIERDSSRLLTHDAQSTENKVVTKGSRQPDVLELAEPYFKHHWQGTRAKTWYLDLLAVDIKQQGKGYGGSLVRWGVRQAERDGICASVIASAVAERLYAQNGFITVGRANEGSGNPLAGLEGGCIMFKDFPGKTSKRSRGS